MIFGFIGVDGCQLWFGMVPSPVNGIHLMVFTEYLSLSRPLELSQTLNRTVWNLRGGRFKMLLFFNGDSETMKKVIFIDSLGRPIVQE